MPRENLSKIPEFFNEQYCNSSYIFIYLCVISNFLNFYGWSVDPLVRAIFRFFFFPKIQDLVVLELWINCLLIVKGTSNLLYTFYTQILLFRNLCAHAEFYSFQLSRSSYLHDNKKSNRQQKWLKIKKFRYNVWLEKDSYGLTLLYKCI